jgi:hypothetical protein
VQLVLLSSTGESTLKGAVYVGQNAERHIAIRSEDPDQLCSFYEKTLGLRMVSEIRAGTRAAFT